MGTCTSKSRQNRDRLVCRNTRQVIIATMLKKDGPTYIRLLNDFDVAFFEERLRHNAFDGNSMVSLVETTFAWIHNLQMPIRDSATFAAKARVMNAGTTMLEVVPVYIQECHTSYIP